ncbi:putative disease resistance protein [Senna tora]|uniref:Putative disease resistance protein n=1 Tax=Senna tora TaxID=362788 RepID=A0A834TNK4_9FABA|nr:putative disease resistance protein [Senna tora]
MTTPANRTGNDHQQPWNTDMQDVRAYRTDPVQVRSCPLFFVSALIYISSAFVSSGVGLASRNAFRLSFEKTNLPTKTAHWVVAILPQGNTPHFQNQNQQFQSLPKRRGCAVPNPCENQRVCGNRGSKDCVGLKGNHSGEVNPSLDNLEASRTGL